MLLTVAELNALSSPVICVTDKVGSKVTESLLCSSSIESRYRLLVWEDQGASSGNRCDPCFVEVVVKVEMSREVEI